MNDIFLSVLTGMLSGMYSGVIVYRYSRFMDNKRKIKDIINSFSYIVHDSEKLSFKSNNSEVLMNISSDFSTQGHRDASKKLFALIELLLSAEILFENDKLKTSEADSIDLKLRRICNGLSPNFAALLLGGKIYNIFMWLYKKAYSIPQKKK